MDKGIRIYLLFCSKKFKKFWLFGHSICAIWILVGTIWKFISVILLNCRHCLFNENIFWLLRRIISKIIGAKRIFIGIAMLYKSVMVTGLFTKLWFFEDFKPNLDLQWIVFLIICIFKQKNTRIIIFSILNDKTSNVYSSMFSQDFHRISLQEIYLRSNLVKNSLHNGQIKRSHFLKITFLRIRLQVI